MRIGEVGSGLLTFQGFIIAFRKNSRHFREVLLVTDSCTYFQESFTSESNTDTQKRTSRALSNFDNIATLGLTKIK